MKRSHEERLDHREGVLNSSVRTVINTAPPNPEKEKGEKPSFGSQLGGNDSPGYRTADLIKSNKPIHSRPIAPASITSPHLPPMPALQAPLLPGLIPGAGHPLLNSAQLHQASFVRGGSLQTAQYPFPTHIPILGAAAAAVAPPRASAGNLRSSVSTLRPSNLQTQVTSNPVGVRVTAIKTPTIASPKTGSPAPIGIPHTLVGNHRLGDVRPSPLIESVHSHASASSAPPPVGAVASIQVMAPNESNQSSALQSGTSKTSHINALHSALKIGPVSSQSSVTVSYPQQVYPVGSATPSSASAVAAFKLPGVPNSFALGVGQLYSQPPVMIPSSVTSAGHSRPDSQPSEIRPSAAHCGSVITSSLSSLSSSNSSHQSPLHVTSEARNDRGQAVSQAVTYGTTYYFRDPVSGFPHMHQINNPMAIHSLLRPPLGGTSQPGPMNSLPLLAVDSSRGRSTSLPLGPLTSSTKPGPSNLVDSRHAVSDTQQHPSSHGNSSTQPYNRYPNLQPSSYMSILPATNSNSPRPSILRKRPLPVEGYGLFPSNFFPVQTSEKVASPTRSEHASSAHHIMPFPVVSSTQTSLPLASLNDAQQGHSDSGSVGSDSTASASESSQGAIGVQGSDSKREVDAQNEKHLQGSTLPPAAHFASTLISTGEASPRKKPRKQLVITTEDKYGMETPIERPSSDEAEDEEEEEDDDCSNASDSLAKLQNFGYGQPFPSTVHPRQHLLLHSDEQKRSSGEQFWQPEKHRTPTQPYEQNKTPKFKSEQLDGTEKDGGDNVKQFVVRRPHVTILGDYKVNSKAAFNHFYRYSDVRVKDDRRHTCSDIANRKSSRNSASCWKLFHVSSQLDDLSSLEEDVCSRMLDFQACLPKPSRPQTQHQKSPLDEHLRLLHELIQGNIQRCRLSIEQLKEGKQTMMKVLDYKPKAMELLKKYKQRKSVKKKQCSSH